MRSSLGKASFLNMLNINTLVLLLVLLSASFSCFSKNDKDTISFFSEEKNDIQMLVLLKYTRLSSEIKIGKGVHLDALLYLMKQKKTIESKGEILRVLRLYLQNSRDIFHFSSQVKSYSVF